VSSIPVAEKFGLHAPYPGLRAFSTNEWPIFFGRHAYTERLRRILLRRRFLAVLGGSGSGKSSLVRAGLIASLERKSFGSDEEWFIASMRPQDRPIANLAQAIRTQILGKWNPEDQTTAATLEATLRRGDSGLIDLLSECGMPACQRVLIFVDQFEELFTYGRQRDEAGREGAVREVEDPELEAQELERSAFVRLLLHSVSPENRSRCGIHIALTMRSEYLGRCTRFERLPQQLNLCQYLTPKMTRDERQLAIECPMEVFGKTISPTLVNFLLNDSSREGDSLPLLQHCLVRMIAGTSTDSSSREESAHSIADGRPGDLSQSAVEVPEGEDTYDLNLRHYLQIGLLPGSLDRYAESVYESLADPDKTTARILFQSLTGGRRTQADTRRTTTIGEVARVAERRPTEVEAVVRKFGKGEAGFVIWEGEGLESDTILDLAHESLIRTWKTLSTWAEAESEMAARYRALVAIGRQGGGETTVDEGLISQIEYLRASREAARAWASRYGTVEDLPDHLSDLTVVVRLLEQSRKALRKQRFLSSGFLGLLVLLVLMGAFAYAAIREKRNAIFAAEYARKEADKADKLKQKADSAEVRESNLNKKLIQDKAQLENDKDTIQKQEARIVADSKHKEMVQVQAAREETRALNRVLSQSIDRGTPVMANAMSACLSALPTMDMKGSDAPLLIKTLRLAIQAASGLEAVSSPSAPLADDSFNKRGCAIDDKGTKAAWMGTDGYIYLWKRGVPTLTRIGTKKAGYYWFDLTGDGHYLIASRPLVAPAPLQTRSASHVRQDDSDSFVTQEWWDITKDQPTAQSVKVERQPIFYLSTRPDRFYLSTRNSVKVVHIGRDFSGSWFNYPLAYAGSTVGSNPATDDVTYIAESPGGKYLAVRDTQNRLCILDVEQASIKFHTPYVAESVKFSPHGDRLAFAVRSTKTVYEYLCDFRNESKMKGSEFPWHLPEAADALAYTPDGSLIAGCKSGGYALTRDKGIVRLASTGWVWGNGLVANNFNNDYYKMVRYVHGAKETYTIREPGTYMGSSLNCRFDLQIDRGVPLIVDTETASPDYSKASPAKLEARAREFLKSIPERVLRPEH
jgi:hypothetical protein